MLCLFAGATRSLGVALAGAGIALAALVQSCATAGSTPWRPAAGAVLAPFGVLGFWGYLWASTGQPRRLVLGPVAGVALQLRLRGLHPADDHESLTQGNSPVIVVCSLVVVASIALVVALAVGRAPLADGLRRVRGRLTFGTEDT